MDSPWSDKFLGLYYLSDSLLVAEKGFSLSLFFLLFITDTELSIIPFILQIPYPTKKTFLNRLFDYSSFFNFFSVAFVLK